MGKVLTGSLVVSGQQGIPVPSQPVTRLPSPSPSAGSTPQPSQTSAQVAALNTQAAALYAQMESLSSQISARETVDNQQGRNPGTDPTIVNLSARWSKVAAQYRAVQQQLAAL